MNPNQQIKINGANAIPAAIFTQFTRPKSKVN